MNDPLVIFIIVLVLMAILARIAKKAAREAGIPSPLSSLALSLMAR